MNINMSSEFPIRWCGYDWSTNNNGEEIHPDRLNCWQDPSAISFDADDYAHLKTHNNPKYFPQYNVTAKIGVGWLGCREWFKHGTFEIEAKLPTGRHLWPAFWLYSWQGWPPEIDIFEGYTGNDKSYFSWNIFKPWSVKTNAYIKTPAGKHKALGAKKHYWGWFNSPAIRFVKYKMIWKRDKIEIYYDGNKVRTIKDNTLLAQCNAGSLRLHINNMVEPDANTSNSDFIVKSFRYTPE